MRASWLAVTAAIGLSTLTAVRADPAPKVVHLYSYDSLAQLRLSNPRAYATARRIMAAAPELCRAGKPDVSAARFNAEDVKCMRYMWRTSYPPKLELNFRIDDTLYIALVTVRDLDGRVIHIQ